MGLDEFGLEGGESGGLSSEAVEKLSEQLRENAAAVKAMRQQEGKQRDKDNKLVAILMKFVKSNQNSVLVELIVRLLNENVPASFILAIILLAYEEIQKELGVNLSLPEGFQFDKKLLNAGNNNYQSLQKSEENSEEFILTAEKKLILKMWTESVINASLENPYKILRTIKDNEGNIKSSAIQLTAFIIRDFFEKDFKGSIDFEMIHGFAQLTMKQILHEVDKRTSEGQLKGETIREA